MISFPEVKVNLGLEVLRKRPDGYHDLNTLFVPCKSYHDTLEIITGDDYSRTSSALAGKYSGDSLRQAISPDGKLMITIARAEGVDWDPLSDLTAKAYALLSQDFTMPCVKVFLEKTSPVGAGLGGGSSDAAAALGMLNSIASLGLDEAALAGYAARLGSDCACFIYGRPMLGEGRGEILTPVELPVLDGYELKVVVPEGIHVSTREAYGGITPREDPRYDGPVHPMPFREIFDLPVESWKELLFNDFETTVFALHPKLADIKASLYREGAAYASMSGSGSAVFGLFPR